MNNKHLIAAAGMLLTNGKMCVAELWLGNGNSPDNWWEITKEEAAKFDDATSEIIQGG